MIDPSKPSTNSNDNCLEGKRCPNCGSYGPFELVVSLRVSLYDSGTDDAEDGSIDPRPLQNLAFPLLPYSNS